MSKCSLPLNMVWQVSRSSFLSVPFGSATAAGHIPARPRHRRSTEVWAARPLVIRLADMTAPKSVRHSCREKGASIRRLLDGPERCRASR